MGKARAESYNGLGALYKLRQVAERNEPPCDKAFAEQYPLLFSILTSNAVEDGKYVDGVSLSIRNAGGDWRFTLGCQGLRMYGDVLGPTIAEGLAQVEQRLGAGTFPWKADTRKSARVREQKAK